MPVPAASRKPRKGSTLDHLPADARQDLIDWLLGGHSYLQAKAALQDKHGIATSLSALGRFYQSDCAPLLIEQRSALYQLAKQLHDSSETKEAAEAAIYSALRDHTLHALRSPGTLDAAAVSRLIRLLQDKDRSDRDWQKLQLQIDELTRREEAARSALTEEKLDPAQRNKKLLQIFGIN